jgi:hypothetical protein
MCLLHRVRQACMVSLGELDHKKENQQLRPTQWLKRYLHAIVGKTDPSTITYPIYILLWFIGFFPSIVGLNVSVVWLVFTDTFTLGGGDFALMPCNSAFFTKLNPRTVSRLIFKILTIMTKSGLRNFRAPCLVTVALLHLRIPSSARQACWKYRIMWASGGATFLQTPAISYFFTGAATLGGPWPPPWVRNSNFSRGGVVSPTPSPNLEDRGRHFAWPYRELTRPPA